MKKWYVLCLLVLLFALTLAACGNGGGDAEDAYAPSEYDEEHTQEEPAEEGPTPLSATTTEVEFNDLILTFSEDIRHEVTDSGTLEIFYTEEEFPRTRVILVSENTALDTAAALERFGGIDHTPAGDMESFTVNGKDAYIQHFYDGGDNPFILAFVMGNRATYAINFVADQAGFDGFFSYFQGILDHIDEIEVDSHMLYDRALLVQLCEYVNDLAFTEIVAMVDAYLADVDASADDIAHEVRELAVRGAELLEQAYVYTDEFDGRVTVYYPGVRAISTDINILPYIRPGGRVSDTRPRGSADLHIDFGFYRTGWLFFDRASLRMSDDSIWEQNFGAFDTNRDVIRGGTIREVGPKDWGLVNHNTVAPRLFERMDVEYDHVLRFINRGEDTHHDVTLSELEIRAVSTLGELYWIMGQLGFRMAEDFS